MEIDMDNFLKLVENERLTAIQGSFPSSSGSQSEELSPSENKKTYLLVDNTTTEQSFKAFERSSKFAIFDAKLLHRKFFVRKSPLGLLLDEFRNVLVYAIRHGKILIIRMQDVAVDFLNTFNDESYYEQHHGNHNSDLIGTNPHPPYEKWWYLPRGFMLHHGEMLRHHPFPYCLFRRNDWNEVKGKYGEEYGPERYVEPPNPSLLTNHSMHVEDDEEEEIDDFSAAYDLANPHHNQVQKHEPIHFSPHFRIVITTTIPVERVEDMLFNGRFGLPANSSNHFQCFVVQQQQ